MEATMKEQVIEEEDVALTPEQSTKANKLIEELVDVMNGRMAICYVIVGPKPALMAVGHDRSGMEHEKFQGLINAGADGIVMHVTKGHATAGEGVTLHEQTYKNSQNVG
jgi:hypothetical protein